MDMIYFVPLLDKTVNDFDELEELTHHLQPLIYSQEGIVFLEFNNTREQMVYIRSELIRLGLVKVMGE